MTAETWSPDEAPTPGQWQTCRLCGRTEADVRVALGCIRDSPQDRAWRAFPRCSRTNECRWRREANGKDWPLVDASRATPPADARAYLAAMERPGQADPEPARGDQTGAQAGEEDHPWLR